MIYNKYMEKKTKIGIIGTGNIGRSFAVALASKGYYVEGVMGKSYCNIQVDTSYAFSITGGFGNHTQLIKIVDKVENLSNDLDIVIICTRVYDGAKAIRELKNKISDKTAIVTIQNMFWIDKLYKLYPENIVCAYLDFSCWTERDITHIIDFAGIKLGVIRTEAFDKMKLCTKVFSEITRVEEKNDMMGFVLSRNIVNITISALGVISGRNLGEILVDWKGRVLFKKVMQEIVRVFDFYKIKILPYNNKLDYYLFTENSIRAKIYRHKIYKLLRKNNPYVRSSALCEIEQGKKSELKFILENLLRNSNFHKISTPYTSAIFDMLCEIEKGTRRINRNAFYDKKILSIKE